MSNKVYILKDSDVVCTSSSALMYQCTFKVSEYLTIIQTKLEAEQLLAEGLDCELLRPNQPWIKGKVKIRLEFEPDEGELEKIKEGVDFDNNGDEDGKDPTKAIPTFPSVPDPNQNPNNLETFPKAEGMWS